MSIGGEIALDDGLRLEPLQFLDQCGAFEIQALRGLTFVAVGAFERALDERELLAPDVTLEIEAFLGKPDFRRLGGIWLLLNLGREIRDVDLRPALTERD